MTEKDHLKELFSAEQIGNRVAELGRRISEDFETEMENGGKPLVLLGVLKGSFMFLADLARQITLPVEIEFVSMSSYGNRLESLGMVELRLSPPVDLENRCVLIVEDIVDTGRSLAKLLEHLQTLGPKEIRICVLLDKPEARIIDVPIQYIGFEAPMKFIVGYGLDAAQQYRALGGIYELEERKTVDEETVSSISLQ